MTTFLATTSTRGTRALGTAPDAGDRLRLRLRDPERSGGFVDGGWWPHSLDLVRELPPLLAVLSAAGWDVRRVVYHRDAWDPAPRRLAASGGPITLGGYLTQDAALITLVDVAGWRQVELVVIPPATDPAVAARAMTLAARDSDLHHAGEILTRAGEILERVDRDRPTVNRAGCVDPFPEAGMLEMLGSSQPGPAVALP